MARRAPRVAKSESREEPLVVDEITLDGQAVRVRNANLPLAEVKLDPTNPRVANTVALNVRPDNVGLQQELESLLWADPDVHDLYRQILINKGLIERIIVRENLVVAEGNCRTVAYRKLHANYRDDPTWRTIPARILPGDISERAIAILLGEMHVAGKNTWTPFEKAGHLYKLHKEFALTQDEIAQRFKTSKSKVSQSIRAFDVMKNKYLAEYQQPGAIRKFSYFLELFKNPELREWARSDGAVDRFADWVGTGKFSRGEDVRDLPDILKNPQALRAFSDQGCEAARKVLEEDRPELSSPLLKQMIAMTRAIEDARLDEIQRIRSAKGGSSRRVVADLNGALARFMELCGGDT